MIVDEIRHSWKLHWGYPIWADSTRRRNPDLNMYASARRYHIDARRRMRSLRPATVASLAAVAMTLPTSMGLLVSGVPTVICPLPALVIWPAVLLSNLRLQYA